MATKKPSTGSVGTAAAAATKPEVSGGNAGAAAKPEVSGNAGAAAGNAAANIPAASTFDPSGAPQQVVGDVNVDHPAVDANPRANTSVDQNRIDFNDPTLSGAEAVEQSLKKQGGE